MSSGQITKCTQSVWKKAGLGEGMSMNIMRKSAVSSVHQKIPEISSELTQTLILCHLLTTAQKCHCVVEREKPSAVASMGLRGALASTSAAVSNEQNSMLAEMVPSKSASNCKWHMLRVAL